MPNRFIRWKNEISAAQTDIVSDAIEYADIPLPRIKRDCTKKKFFLRQSQEDTEYLRNIFSVLLPERFIREVPHVAPSAPGISGCLQRVDPFTVAPGKPAPESVTPSVDACHFPANFISKLLFPLYRFA